MIFTWLISTVAVGWKKETWYGKKNDSGVYFFHVCDRYPAPNDNPHDMHSWLFFYRLPSDYVWEITMYFYYAGLIRHIYIYWSLISADFQGRPLLSTLTEVCLMWYHEH